MKAPKGFTPADHNNIVLQYTKKKNRIYRAQYKYSSICYKTYYSICNTYAVVITILLTIVMQILNQLVTIVLTIVCTIAFPIAFTIRTIIAIAIVNTREYRILHLL